MKRVVYIILMMVWGCTLAQAQPEKRMERIHAIKVAYIADKLKLSTEQSEKFWPVYNRFEDEKMEIRNMYRKQARRNATETESIRNIDEDIEMQEKVLQLRKKYKDEFLRVLTPQQLATLIESEREFKKMLLEQLNERRGGRKPIR